MILRPANPTIIAAAVPLSNPPPPPAQDGYPRLSSLRLNPISPPSCKQTNKKTKNRKNRSEETYTGELIMILPSPSLQYRNEPPPQNHRVKNVVPPVSSMSFNIPFKNTCRVGAAQLTSDSSTSLPGTSSQQISPGQRGFHGGKSKTVLELCSFARSCEMNLQLVGLVWVLMMMVGWLDRVIGRGKVVESCRDNVCFCWLTP